MLTRYPAECHEHSEIDSTGVVEDAPNKALDMFDVCIAEEGRRVGREGRWALLPNCLGWGA